MLINGILNPAINHLLSRVRHTNTLIISDQGFPWFPGIEVVDLSLIADMPRVIDVLGAVRSNFRWGRAVMAAEFLQVQPLDVLRSYDDLLQGVEVKWVPHIEFKQRAPGVVGIIRTGDTTRFGNILLEST